MQIKRTKTHFILKVTPRELDTIRAALDSIAAGTDEGAYMDVVRLEAALDDIMSRLSLYESNVWVSAPKRKK